MASTDAFWPPRKNTAFRITFPIYDADGDLVTGATGLDSEVSKDGGAMADCTNEATEIATSSGIYYLDLTSTEMNADTVAIIVKTSSSGAKTTVMILYPQEDGDQRVDVRQWLGTAAATPTVAGVPEVDVTHWIGTAAATPTVAGVPEVDITHYLGTAAQGASGRPQVDVELWLGSAPNALASGRVDASVGAMAADVITASAIAADAIGSSELAATAASEIATAVRTELTTELGRVDVAVSTRLASASYTAPDNTSIAAILVDTGTTLPAQIAALNNLSAAEVNAEVVDALNTDTYAEPGQGNPGATISLAQKIGYLYKAFRNRKTQTSTTFSLYADDATTVDQKSTVSDNGTTAERGEIVTGP